MVICETSHIERNKKRCIWEENLCLRFCPTCSVLLTNNRIPMNRKIHPSRHNNEILDNESGKWEY